MRNTKRILTLCWLMICCLATSAHAQPLGEFINQVLRDNPGMQAAESNVAAAKAREHASEYPIYNPELSAQKQDALENQSYIGISQTVDWANKRGAREQVGIANVEVALAELASLRQQLAAQILSALAQYQSAQQAVSLAQERTRLLSQFVRLTQKRFKNGDIARVDLDLAQLAFSEATAQQADAEVNQNQALQVLRASTGFSQTVWPRLPAHLPRPSLKNINIDALISHLPSVQVSNHQYKTAISRIKVAERDRYPDPTLSFQGGNSSSDGQSKRLLTFTVSLPLFVLNPYKAEVQAASFDAIEADGKRFDIMRQSKAAIESSAERYQTLYSATKQWQQAAGKPLSDGMLLIERLWQAGEINSTDYIFQVKQRIDSQIAGVELKGRAWEAWAEWLKASGQIDSWLEARNSEGELS